VAETFEVDAAAALADPWFKNRLDETGILVHGRPGKLLGCVEEVRVEGESSTGSSLNTRVGLAPDQTENASAGPILSGIRKKLGNAVV
jgi:hypothetical protein